MAHGLRLYQAYDRDAGVKDIKDTIDAVRNLPGCNGKVALLGYCLGALMVFMTAVRNDGIDAAVWYHGADTENIWERSMGFMRRILMHLAEEDEFISKAAQAEIKAALAKKPNATVYSYPGQSHAFSRHNGKHYNAAAAHLANGRTSEFLKRELRYLLRGRIERSLKDDPKSGDGAVYSDFLEAIRRGGCGLKAAIGHPDMADSGKPRSERRPPPS